MQLKEAENYYNKIVNKGYTIGLDFDDYIFLKNILYDIEHTFSFDDAKEELINKINELLTRIYNSGILHLFTEAQRDYICKNSFLLPLVLANNKGKIVLYSKNSYAFNCQFHKDSKNQMGVTDYNNLMYCYGCRVGFNIISYLEKIECLTYKEVLMLLSRIYLYETKKINNNLDCMVDKYRQSILSDDYKKILDMGYERLIKKNIKCLDNQDIETIYEKRFETIERIRNNEYDLEYKKLNKSQPKILKLK